MVENKECSLKRDEMGIRPLYYYLKEHDFAYAEDLRELCARPGADLSVNENWLYLECRGANSLSLTETEFKYINAVRPGSVTTFTHDSSGWTKKEEIYWEPGRKKIRFPKDEDYVRELRRLVETAIREELAEIDGLVGAEASGGLDSSVIDILISRMGRDACYVSWSSSFDEIPMQPVDERQVVQDVVGQEGKTFHFLPPETDETNDAIARFLPPFINTLQLSRTAKLVSEHGATTVFTGHGGDEGVSHRSNMVELWYHGEYGAFLRETWHNNKGRKLRLARTVKQILWGIFKDLPERKRGWQNEDHDLRCCMNPDFLASQKNTKFPPLYFSFDPVRYILQGGSRSRLDNCAVQAKDYGVRYVFPFLDPRVVDFAVSIPRRLYRKNGQTRWIYREAFKDLMPQSLYEVNYKDFPSLRDYKPPKKEEPEQTPEQKERARREWIEANLNQLDWSRWNRYFDLDACEKLLSQDLEKLDDHERQRIFILTCRLYTCALIQNLWDNAGKWAEKQREKAD